MSDRRSSKRGRSPGLRKHPEVDGDTRPGFTEKSEWKGGWRVGLPNEKVYAYGGVRRDGNGFDKGKRL